MVSKVFSSSTLGVDAYRIDIEVDITHGLPNIVVVGLPDTAVKEAKDRVRAAIKNSCFEYPPKRITVNLAPANIKKEGPSLDLAIAIGILTALEKIPQQEVTNYFILGELALDGSVRPVKGILPIATFIKEHYPQHHLIVPSDNAHEAGFLNTIAVHPVRTLSETIAFLQKKHSIPPISSNLSQLLETGQNHECDFSEVKGQGYAKRALEIAVAGGHNVLMIGPPGSGKTMLAKRIPTIMPKLSPEEALETTTIHSVSGTLRDHPLITIRPFRAPHHTASDVALIGGGTFPRPGEVSLAHNGILFLDEIAEFHRNVLEVLRQPLEDGQVTISRAAHALTFPARFMLVCAMNPCPCGFFTDPKRACHCPPQRIQKYLGRLSGPLLDRIDIHLEIAPVNYTTLSQKTTAETSTTIRERIYTARKKQTRRFSRASIHTNAHMLHRHIRKYCQMDNNCKELMRQAMDELGFSARAHDKILKVARTISDLAGSEHIREEHISEAIGYRSLDRDLWGGG